MDLGQRILLANCRRNTNETGERLYSAFTLTKSYVVTLADDTSYILKVSSPLASIPSTDYYMPNSLSEESTLSKVIAEQTDIPIPKVLALDTTCTLIPYPYLLLSDPPGIPLATARDSGKLTPRQMLLLDLRVGSYLKQLHERVQNDWFGLPSQEKDELYSWQEAFTWQLEALLSEAHNLDVELPFEEVRRYLSRAIGSFLFDDCEVPSLVSFTGDDNSVFIDYDLESPPETDEIEITSFSILSHAIWGDPLLETLFMDPSPALLEGYGGPLVIFPRQKTKRIWYTLFLALMVLVQTRRYPARWPESDWNTKIEWAKNAVEKCISELKDAPCY